MLFLELYNLLLENDFSSFPQDVPYGAWIAPSGEITLVRNTFMHAAVADDIVSGNPKLKEEFLRKRSLGIHTSSWRFLQSLNYMRCVRSTFAGTTEFLYDSISHDGERLNLNSKQLRAVKDIAAFYGINAERTGSTGENG